jgi:hypothetical protein
VPDWAWLSKKAITEKTAPILVRLINQVAQRFDAEVMEKVTAQSVPFVGALGGALVNAVFTEHFNTVARYHFGLRRLELTCGESVVQDAYQKEFEALRKQEAPYSR